MGYLYVKKDDSFNVMRWVDSPKNRIRAERWGLKIVKAEDVEEDLNMPGMFYLRGHIPQKSQEQLRGDRLAALQKLLNSTDWYAVRFAETGKEIPADVLAARQAARAEIDALREEEK